MECYATATELALELKKFIARSVQAHGGSTAAVNPGNRIPFFWPPHPESYRYHIHPADWIPGESIEIGGENFGIEIADTREGLFGRVPDLWFEAKAVNIDELKSKLATGVQPLLDRQWLTAMVLERPSRFTGHVDELSPLDLLKLLYCPDRDVANDGRREIETHASTGYFYPALMVVLQDRTHPYRRSAQWAVLDLFEDLSCFAKGEDDWMAAVESIKSLIWDAEDDYARTIFKAGVVLGGHMPYLHGARALVECLKAPSRIGRRSAIHGMYHLAEWAPEHRDNILERLQEVSASDPEPTLRQYATAMGQDVARADTIHVEDVWFPEES